MRKAEQRCTYGLYKRNFRRIFARRNITRKGKDLLTINRTFWRLCAGLCLGLCLSTLPSCTQDNVHLPADGTGQETWEPYTATYPGLLSTTVPLMQQYMQGPVETQMTLSVSHFHPSHSAYVGLHIPAFSIGDPFVTDLLGQTIEIGEMDITDVEYAAFPTGGGYLRCEAFEVQAGAYRVRGSLHGELSASGRLTLTVSYRPGTMPFDVVSEFDTNQ